MYWIFILYYYVAYNYYFVCYRVTDDFDRRLVNVYIGELFCEEAVNANNFELSELPEYFIPTEGDL